MKKDKLTVLYSITSLICYIAGILNFLSDDVSGGLVFVCIASSFLCLSFSNNSKNRKKDDTDGDK